MTRSQHKLVASRDAEVIQAQSASPEEWMYADIYAAIMEHRLPAGIKLTEQSLGNIYGLARYAVRRVLARLAADGLIDLERNRGAFIASPTEQEAHEMFELRQTLEQSVIPKAVANASAADFRKLRDLIAREREAYMQGNRSLWIRLSADFHIDLAKLSGNMLLVDMLRRLVSRTTLMISPHEAGARQPCSFDEHLSIVHALEEHDAGRAQQAMSHHLEQCACRMMHRLDKRFDLRSVLGRQEA